jgi:hypothetical protein
MAITPPSPVITSWSPDSVDTVDYGVTNSNLLTINGTANANYLVTVFDNGTKIGTTTANSAGIWSFKTPAVPNGIDGFTATQSDSAGDTSSPTFFPTHAIVDTTVPTTPTLVGGAQIGVMIEGPEQSWTGFPSASDLDFLKSNGVNLVRLPITWELMQNTLNGPLNQTYLSGLETFLGEAAQRGMKVIVTLDNDALYDANWQGDEAARGGHFSGQDQLGQPIGSAAVPVSAFTNFWTQLSTALVGNPGVGGYDLMNEPAYVSPSAWQTDAQSAVNAIRTVDTKTALYVAGAEWTVPSTWALPWYSGSLSVTDPDNNLYYEGHQFADPVSNGLSYSAYNPSTDYANMYSDLLQPWVQWLNQHSDKGLLGEFGVPVNDPKWLSTLDSLLDYMQEKGIAGTYCNYTYNQAATTSIAPNYAQGAAAMNAIFEHTAPSIAGYTPNNGAGNGATTTANVLTLSGTGASYDTVKIFDNGVLLGTTTSGINGAWSYKISALANGANSFSASNVNASGASSEMSYSLAVTIGATGTSPPPTTVAAPTGLADAAIVGGYVDQAHDTSAQTLTGTAPPGATVTVYYAYSQGIKAGTTTANATTGAWSYHLGDIANGNYTLTATATDAAGHVSGPSAALNFTVATTAPAAPSGAPAAPTGLADAAIVGAYVPQANNTSAQTLTGSALLGSTVTVYYDYDLGIKAGTTTANATTGAWSYHLGDLANGNYTLSATATNAAGNVSGPSAALDFSIAPGH